MKVSNSWVLDKLNWLESKIIDNSISIDPFLLDINFDKKLWFVGEGMDGFFFVRSADSEALERESLFRLVPDSATAILGSYKMYLVTEDDDTVRSYLRLLHPHDAT